MPDETDAKKILTASSVEKTTRLSSFYVDEDCPARPEIQ